MQTEPWLERVKLAFGHHLAVQVSVEAVDHYPVQPGDGAHLVGDPIAEVHQPNDRLQPTDCRPHQREEVAVRVNHLARAAAGGLAFKHHHAIGGVHADIKRRHAVPCRQREREQGVALDRVGRQHFQQSGLLL